MMPLEEIKELNKEPEGCGIAKIWLTSEKDPLRPACIAHDRAYDAAVIVPGQYDGDKLRKADKAFWASVRILSRKNRWLRARAILYYVLVTAWRIIRR